MDPHDPTDGAIRQGEAPYRSGHGHEAASNDWAVQARGDPSPRRAAAMIALAWLPAIVVAASLPWFVPIFDRWPRELPPLTLALMPLGRLGVMPIVLAGVVLVAALAGLYAGWARAELPGGRAVALAFAAAGLGAFAVCIVAALGPMLMFRIP